jgi:DNA-binding CsgD family transcriptional regulator
MTNVEGPTRLLERDFELSALWTAFDEVSRRSRGQLVVVSGEAGVGKTALVRAVCNDLQDRARVLWGACEPLATPTPLAALVEIARACGGSLVDLVTGRPTPYEVALGLVEELTYSAPTVLVLEDVHWADDATLDVLRILSRRYEELETLIVVSHRELELDPRHPIRRALGEVPTTAAIRRLRLAPLSLEAVRSIAEEHGADGFDLYQKTGGNPFFVGEALRGGGGVPATVREAVLARAARLSLQGWSLLEAVAVVAVPAEFSLVETLAPGALEAADECVAEGLLVVAERMVAFKHELARLAVAESIGPVRSTVLHRAALQALEGDGDEHEPTLLARLSRHAEAAGDERAVLAYAPAAAAHAASVGAHHAAAAEYARALEFTQSVPRDVYAGLCLQRSLECYIATLDVEAEESIERAIAVYRELGDLAREADALSWLAIVQRNAGRAPEAMRTAERAIALLEELPAGHALATAYCAAAAVELLGEDADATIRWTKSAARLARACDDQNALATATQLAAAAEAIRGAPGAIEDLERSLADAVSRGNDDHVGRAYTLLGMAASRERSLERMERYVSVGLPYCEERDLAVWSRFLLSMRSWLELEQGAWDEASQTVSLVLLYGCTLSTVQAQVVLALLRARRGDPDPWSPLESAAQVAEPNGQLWWTGQIAAARAEAAWLAGRPELVGAATEDAFRAAVAARSPWPTAELALWRRRAGIAERIPGPVSGPYALELERRPEAAADEWRASGCPYEAALALAAANDERLLRRSLEELLQLGAHPAAAIVTRRLRALGAHGVPRGPRPSTRDNAAGLTRRETEVLVYLAQGLRNRQIAERLYLSSRTVDSHVSSILRKVNASGRTEALRRAQLLGLLDEPAAGHADGRGSGVSGQGR